MDPTQIGLDLRERAVMHAMRDALRRALRCVARCVRVRAALRVWASRAPLFSSLSLLSVLCAPVKPSDDDDDGWQPIGGP
jgi:hypothetical protein